jgi:formiminoglutamase
MSNASSSVAAWWSRLEPVSPPTLPSPTRGEGKQNLSPLVGEGRVGGRPDDPRLGECVEFWREGAPPVRPGRPVLLGFPQDEGVRRNQGRPGAAAAPAAIRHWLYRLTPWDAVKGVNLAALHLLDLGDVRISGTLEESQQALAEVVAAIVTANSVPIVLGGGHETAYGHYLGYVYAGREVAIINLDAHLDVRPLVDGQGHSGSPFRQALEHPTQPLRGDSYVCLGAQPFAVSREHQAYVQDKGGVIRWASRPNVRGLLGSLFLRESKRLSTGGCSVYVTLDSDIVQQADVPGVSAPNPLGLSGRVVASCAEVIGATAAVSSFDLVEINPSYDRDGQSARWAALTIWHFLAGLARRSS